MKLKGLLLQSVIVIATLTSSVQVSAHDLITNFESIGVESTTLHGQKSQLNLSIPVPDYLNKSDLAVKLDFNASSLLNTKNSYISVYSNGQPLVTSSLPDTNIFSWTIDKLTGKEGAINLQIIANLVISDEACKDIGNPGLWLKLLKSSSLLGDTLDVENNSLIAGSLFSKQAIVVPKGLQVQQEPAVGKLAFAIEKIIGKKLPIIYFSELKTNAVNDYVFISLEDQIPAVLKNRLSFQAQPKAGRIELIKTAESDTSGTVYGNVLVISGLTDNALNKAVNLFLNKKIINAAFTNRSVVINAEEPNNIHETPLSPYLSLQELGASSFPLGGLGSSNSSFKFKRSDVVLPCTYVDLNLLGNFSGLKAEDKAFLNIYLNQQLIFTSPLENSLKIDASCKIKMDELLEDNLITYEFLYLPGNNECNLSANSFVAQINTKESGIIFPNNASRKPATFNYFPENFFTDDISIIYSPDFGIQNISVIKEMLHILNSSRGLKAPIIPKIVNTKEVRFKEHKSNNRILLLSIGDSALFNDDNSVLDRVGDKITVNRKGEEAFTIMLDNQVSLGQIYEDGELVLSVVADPLGDRNGLVQIIERLSSNMAKEPVDLLVSRDRDFSFLQSATVQGDSRKSSLGVSSFWSKYGVFISILVVVLILLGFFLVNRKQDLTQDFE